MQTKSLFSARNFFQIPTNFGVIMRSLKNTFYFLGNILLLARHAKINVFQTLSKPKTQYLGNKIFSYDASFSQRVRYKYDCRLGCYAVQTGSH
jgi:hypothetical protein